MVLCLGSRGDSRSGKPGQFHTPAPHRQTCKLFRNCIFVNDVRPKRRKNNQVQRIVKRPAGVEREGRSEAEERPNEARRAARRGEIIAR